MPEEMRQIADRLEALVARLEQCQASGSPHIKAILLDDIAACVQAARGEQNWSLALLDHAFDAFVGVNEAGHVVDWKHRAERLFGYSPAEAIGAPLVELVLAEQDRADGAR